MCAANTTPTMQQVDIDWGEAKTAVPAFITLVTMPLTYSIAYGA